MADKMIQVNDGTDNLYPVCSPVVNATLTGTYISSGSVSWTKSGRVVVFSAKFVPKQAIQSSVGELTASKPLPIPMSSQDGDFHCRDTSTGEVSGRYANVTATGKLYPIGVYTANITYSVSGAYISAT